MENLTVIGCGKIGLPLAVAASLSYNVTGLDSSNQAVENLNNGNPVGISEPLLNQKLIVALRENKISFTTSHESALAEAQIVVVCIPLVTGTDKRTQFEPLLRLCESLASMCKSGTLIIFETTLPIGTTSGALAPIFQSSGKDFYISYSPERISSGSYFKDFLEYPKIVGGLSEEATLRAEDFYFRVAEGAGTESRKRGFQVLRMSSATEAEFVKIAETTYRDVNIALANSFAITAERYGCDIRNVVTAANSQPYSHIHKPGVAVGGHCIPVYADMYLESDPQNELVAAGRNLNSDMPSWVIAKVASALGGLSGRSVLVEGVAYRGGVKEHFLSGAFALREEIEKLGGVPSFRDPLYNDSEIVSLGLKPFSPSQVSEVEAVIIQADHDEVKDFDYSGYEGLALVFDGRGIFTGRLPDAARLIGF